MIKDQPHLKIIFFDERINKVDERYPFLQRHLNWRKKKLKDNRPLLELRLFFKLEVQKACFVFSTQLSFLKDWVTFAIAYDPSTLPWNP